MEGTQGGSMTFTPMGMKTKSEPRQPQHSTHPTSLCSISEVPSVSEWVKDPINLQDLDNLKMHTRQRVLLFIYSEIGSHHIALAAWNSQYRPVWPQTHTDSTASVS